MGGVPPSSMGDMPPLRQTHPTTQSQQPCQQATPYIPTVDVPRRVTFASKTSTPSGASSCYSKAVKTSTSTSEQSQGHSTRPLYREKNYILLIWVFKATGPIPETALEELVQERTREIPHHWCHPC